RDEDGLSQAIASAEEKASGGDLAGAIAAYEKALAPLSKEDKARYYLRSRAKQLTWQQQFDQGQWVDIQPDKEFIGWQRVYGDWTLDEKSGLIGTAKGAP